MQQSVKIPRIDHGYCLLLGNHSFVYQITRNLQCGLCSTLTISRLQHIQMTILDRKLHILHISVMILQSIADLCELLVYFRHNFLQLCDLLRRTYTGYDVLALCIHQEFTHQMLLTGRRVTGKCNTGT